MKRKIDGIPMEEWKFIEKALWNKLVKVLKRIWKEGRIPEDCKMTIIVHVNKKGKDKACI